MIKVKAVRVLQRAAGFELDNDTCYQAPEPFTVTLNGEARGTIDRNVFSLTGLEPGMSYVLRVRTRSGEEGQCAFLTPRETMLLNVQDFGAVDDGVTLCTGALQAALSVCPAGGTVRVPAGTYLTGPLFLRSGVLLYLERGARLLGAADRALYPILPGMIQNEDGTETSYGTWEGNPLDCFASLLTAVDTDDMAVAGEGTVDGNAAAADWWQDPKRRRGAWRPRTIFLNRCRRAVLLGITVCNSPAWTIHPYYCDGVDVIDVTVRNAAVSPNTDGCDPECSANVRILGTRISVGDDCIAIKSGKYYMGVTHPAPSQHITVRNCLLERGHGAVVMGSEIAAGVNDLCVERCLMRGTDRGLRIKTRRGRGSASVVSNIVCRHLTMEDVKTPFVVNMFYFCDPDGHSDYVRCRQPLPVNELTPCVGTLELSDIRCTGCEYAGGYLCGLPERPVQSVTLEDVSFTFRPDAGCGHPAMMDDMPPVSRLGLWAMNVEVLTLRNVQFTGCEGEPVQCEGVTCLTRE